jgi:hypothetical protein
MGYVDTQNAWFKTPAIFMVVVGLVFFVGYGLGVNTNPSESDRIDNLERTLFESQNNQRVVENVFIVKDNATHGHLRIEPSVGIGTIREIWVYKATDDIPKSDEPLIAIDVERNITEVEEMQDLPFPFLSPVFLLEESFSSSPFIKTTGTFPVEVSEGDAFFVAIRFSDKDVGYVESFFVRTE